MDKWPHKVDSHSMSEILAAVADEQWQSFRKSLKGISTPHKLKMLDAYLREFPTPEDKIRVDNYINSLRRGGQLDLDNNVQR